MIQAHIPLTTAPTARDRTRLGPSSAVILFIAYLAVVFAGIPGALEAAKTDAAILSDVRGGKQAALMTVDSGTMRRLHNFQGKYYYIAREIGQGSVRSLLGCLQNNDPTCRKLCADNLYQLRLTYVHRRALLFYLQKEAHLPVKLALQDLLVRINEQRFAQARSGGDVNFLAKITYEEISDFAEKGYPSGERYTQRDFRFLSGGLRNPDISMQIYAVRMLGRIQGDSSQIQKLLMSTRTKTKEARVLSAIDESLGCLRAPTRCPDLQQ